VPDQVQFCFWLEVQKKDLQAQKCQIDSKSDITVIWLLVFFLAFFWSQCHINSKSAITPSPVFFGLAVQRSSGHGGGSFFFLFHSFLCSFMYSIIHLFWQYKEALDMAEARLHAASLPDTGIFLHFLTDFFYLAVVSPPLFPLFLFLASEKKPQQAVFYFQTPKSCVSAMFSKRILL